jgi:hypothetical protein
MTARWLGALASGLWLASCVSSDVSRELGARCDVKEECDERCLAPSAEYPGGFCTRSCVDNGDCPGGSRCVADVGGVCLFVCAEDESCEFLGAGWSCVARDEVGGEGEVEVCRGR